MWYEHEQASQRQRDWNDIDGENYGVGFRGKVKDRAVRLVVKTSVTSRWLRLSAMHAPLLLLK